MKIVFFGSSNFSNIILKKFKKTEFAPSLVITDKLPIRLEGDLFIVASFGKILSKKIINIPKHGCLNVHPSLLPEYRGPSPIQQTILNNDKKTGSTIILMDEKIDHGKIITQKEIKIGKETFLSLEKKLAELSFNLLIEILPKWIEGKINPNPQKESEATYTILLKRNDGKINWKESSLKIERKIRAFDPWPGTFTFWKNIRIKILKGKENKKNLSKIPGKVHKNLIVQCQKGTLKIERLQIEGKKPTNSRDFLNGHPEIIGNVLGS